MNPTIEAGSGHPRLRGEGGGLLIGGEQEGGSSPPARGRDFHTQALVRQTRVIPACAGKGRE